MDKKYCIIFKDRTKMFINQREFEQIEPLLDDDDVDKVVIRGNVLYKSTFAKILTYADYLDQYEGGQYI